MPWDCDVVDSQFMRASSTDHASQVLTNTLTASPNFWSSTGSDPSKPETIVFSLVSPITVVSSVSIKPYRASYQLGQPCYAPRYVRISTGFSPDKATWTSAPMPCRNEPVLQTFEISPRIVCGSFIKIELLERCQTQREDNLYYIVLERVIVNGIPLGALVKDFPGTCEALIEDCVHLGYEPPPPTRHFPEKKMAQTAKPWWPFSGEQIQNSDKGSSTRDSCKNLAPTIDKKSVLAELASSSQDFVNAALRKKKQMNTIRRKIEEGEFRRAGEMMVQTQLRSVQARDTVCQWLRAKHRKCEEMKQESRKLGEYLLPFLNRHVRLTQAESYLFFVALIDGGNQPEGSNRGIRILEGMLRSQIASPSEELGDYYMQRKDYYKAGMVYSICQVPDKMFDVLVHQECYQELANIIVDSSFFAIDVIRRILKLHARKDAIATAKCICDRERVSHKELVEIVEVLGLDTNQDPCEVIKEAHRRAFARPDQETKEDSFDDCKIMNTESHSDSHRRATSSNMDVGISNNANNNLTMEIDECSEMKTDGRSS
eukprot:jgi/Bigna1/89839/estExt_fgenesh1_pg.C_560098